MALYLKYRSKTFDELVKQDHIVNILKPKILQHDYTHSNFLFCGPRWTGKTSTARIFAKAINCLAPIDGNPCNACDNCQLINTNKTLDVIEIDAASHTGVDNIREEVLDKVSYPPAQLKKKVYIIDEVHMLSKGAFNALLKIMEEPPSYLVFILATTEIQKVPETIISRCQIFTFKKIPVVDLVNHLKMICQKEWIQYAEEALVSIAKISDGCARDAIKYLDQVSILWDISQEHVTSFLGVASQQIIQNFLESLIEKNIEKGFALVDTLAETGVDINNFVRQCLIYIEEHFGENISWYVQCTDILKRIIVGIKNFPLPSILMKMEIYNAAGMAPMSIEKPATVQKKWVQITNDTNALPTETVPTQEQWDMHDAPEILAQIAQHEEIKTTIKSILEKSSILEHNENHANLYIFNKLQGSILQKPENRSILEKVYKEITWYSHGLQLIPTTKEEYVAQKL
jgi:DNA polymerase III subunit gamma/tau